MGGTLMALRCKLAVASILLPLLSLLLLSSGCRASPDELLGEVIALTPGIEGVVLSVSLPQSPLAREDPKTRRLALLREAERGLRASSSDPAWQGLFRLAIGDYRGAAEVLSAEAAARGGDLLNDAAVAHLNLGLETNAPLSFLQALDLVDGAIQGLGWSPERGYNRAVILTKLHLVDVALDAWEDVIESGDPYWADLASRHFAELKGRRDAVARIEETARALEEGTLTSAELVSDFAVREPFLARIAVEDHLLGRWAETFDDRHSARVTTDTIRTIADALKQAGRDSLLADAVAVIDTVDDDPVRAVRLRQAHRDYHRARQVYEDQDTLVAEGLFKKAEEGFREVGSPFVYWAAFFRSICAYYRNAKEADRILSALERSADPGYQGLHGRVQWMRGTIDQVGGDAATALKRFYKTRDLMQLSGGERGAAFTNVLIATAYDELGDFRRGWEYRMRALEVLCYTNDYRRIHAMLSEALVDLRRQEVAHISLPLATQLLLNAERWGKPLGYADGLRQRARTWIHLGEYERATRDLVGAREAAAKLPESSLKENILASLDLAEALAEVGKDPKSSTERLDEAFRQQAAAGYLFERLQVCLTRAESLEQQGDLEAAAESLHAAADYFASTGERADDLEIRARSAALARSILERILEYELAKPSVDQEKILRTADQMRSQVAVDIAGKLLATAPQSSTTPLGRRLVRKLPAGVTVVMHTALPKQLLTTVVSRHGVHHRTSPVSKGELASLVGEFVAGVRLNPRNDRVLASAEELYVALVKPAGLSPRDHRVVFVPDASLGVLPMAALRNPETGKLLIEDHEVVNSPSLSLLAQVPPRRTRPKKAAALVVGDPALEPAVTHRLPSLPGALREARAVAELYGRSVTFLAGPAASKKRFLQALASSTVLHFAGHVEVNQDSFVETSLHLAADRADPQGDSRVTLNDLSNARMEQLNLAVLSGCDTATTVGKNREDLGGLAAVFLARGARNVVASLRPVKDSWKSEFLKELHARALVGEAPPSAFRRSILKQVDQKNAGEQTWANYVIFGGLNDGF